MLTFNDDGKLITFEALGDTSGRMLDQPWAAIASRHKR